MGFKTALLAAAIAVASTGRVHAAPLETDSQILSHYLVAGKQVEHVAGLNPVFQQTLVALFAAMPSEIRDNVQILSGYRSPERQAELFAAAVRKYGSVKAARRMVAPPGKSQHQRGMAVDLTFGSKAAKRWMHENVSAFGLRFPMSWEDWHLELATARADRK